MTGTPQEQTILTSDDGSIRLTTQRIIQQAAEEGKVMMLEDFFLMN